MEPAVGLGVGDQPITFIILLIGSLQEPRYAFSKIVLVNEVVPGVVRDRYVDHLDFTEIGLLQQF